MYCTFCELRASFGYCIECSELICVECAVLCARCKRPVCPHHSHETFNQETFCSACLNTRNAELDTAISEMKVYLKQRLEEDWDHPPARFAQLSEALDEVRNGALAFQRANDLLEEKVAERTRELENELLDRQREENLLWQAARRAKDADKAKSSFLAHISHEIRTPMNAVIAMTDLLSNTELDPRQRNYLDTVRRSSSALMSILDDVLDYSKIESGNLTLNLAPFDLEKTVTEVADLLSARAEEKNLSLITRYAPDSPRQFIGDEGRIRQVITNLVSNAIKFTHAGQVMVTVACMGDLREQRVVRIAVYDTGIGIPEERLTRVFKQYAQADGTVFSEYGGTGLGLPICQQLVKLMGGRIGVKSTPGKGSRFRVTLALDVERDKSVDLRTVAENLAGVRTLVVDRDQLSRQFLEKQTGSWGLRVESVATESEAIQRLNPGRNEDDPIRIVLVSHQAPEVDGQRFTESLRREHPSAIPMLALLTPCGQRNDEEAARAAGYRVYLSGAILERDLAAALSTAWTARVNGEPASLVTRDTVSELQQREPAPKTETPPSVRVNILVAEDRPVNQLVAIEIFKSLGCAVDIAASGTEAVKMYKDGDYDLIFMDCDMPEMDGYEATQAIRAYEGPDDHIPIIAMTAHAMKGTRERCLKAGMNDYIAKPVSLKSVRALVDRWYRDDSDDSSGILSVTASIRGVKKLPVLDVERAIRTAGGNYRILERITGVFLDSLSSEMDLLGAAVAKRNSRDVERIAHTIKSAAGSLGGRRVQQIAINLEHAAHAGDMDYCMELNRLLEEEFPQFVEALKEADWDKLTESYGA